MGSRAPSWAAASCWAKPKNVHRYLGDKREILGVTQEHFAACASAAIEALFRELGESLPKAGAK